MDEKEDVALEYLREQQAYYRKKLEEIDRMIEERLKLKGHV